jgi:hypothetical protein
LSFLPLVKNGFVRRYQKDHNLLYFSLYRVILHLPNGFVMVKSLTNDLAPKVAYVKVILFAVGTVKSAKVKSRIYKNKIVFLGDGIAEKKLTCHFPTSVVFTLNNDPMGFLMIYTPFCALPERRSEPIGR